MSDKPQVAYALIKLTSCASLTVPGKMKFERRLKDQRVTDKDIIKYCETNSAFIVRKFDGQNKPIESAPYVKPQVVKPRSVTVLSPSKDDESAKASEQDAKEEKKNEAPQAWPDARTLADASDWENDSEAVSDSEQWDGKMNRTKLANILSDRLGKDVDPKEHSKPTLISMLEATEEG